MSGRLSEKISRIAFADEKGFKAIMEDPTSDGGRVDVSLERNGKRIACEISITTTGEQELGNIKKCINAGYEKVILCSPEKKTLEKEGDILHWAIKVLQKRRGYRMQLNYVSNFSWKDQYVLSTNELEEMILIGE